MSNAQPHLTHFQVSSTLLQYFRARVKKWRLLKHFSENMKSTEVADLAVENTVTKLGGASKPRLVKFGASGIEWRHNPYWESEKDGEWAWALHRQPFWMSMAWAYRATGNEKYALAWRRQMMSWIDMNPRDTRYDYDWGKRFTLDASRRHPIKFEGSKTWPNPVHPEMSWAWRRIDAGKRGIQFPVLLLNFISSPHFTPGLLVALLNSIHEHGEFLANNPFRPFTRDNHGLYEAEGSASLGILFPEFKSAKLWRDRSFDLLKEEIKTELRPDGLQVENVLSYQMGCLRIFTDSYMLAKKNELANAFPKWYMGKIRKLVSAIELVSFPDGRAPHFGDLGSTIFTNNAIKSWFRHFGMERRPHHAQASIALRWSGMYNIRTNWTENASMLLMRCGPSYNAHSHKDAGTFSLFAGGRILLPDSGCFTYTGIKDPIPTDQDRKYFQGTAAHNALTLNDRDAHLPSLESGPYRTLKGYDDCGVMLWQPEDRLKRAQLVIENHKTYRSPDLSHRRAVLELSDGKGFVVIDEAIGEASGKVQAHFHFLPADVKVGAEGMWSTTPGKVNVLVQGMAQVGMTMRPHKTRVSESMGSSVPRPAVTFEMLKANGANVARFVTLVLLFDGTAPPDASVDVFGDPGGNVVAVHARINGLLEKLEYEVDPDRMQMSPPPAEFDVFQEADYVPFYNNFMPSQHVGVSSFPERTCKRDGPLHSNKTAQCSPPVMLSSVQKDKRLSPVVSDQGNYIYCGVPKCGVSRWRRLSRRVAGIAEWADKNAHSPDKNGLTYLADSSDAEAHALINSAALYSFIIVRSPYARLLSGWLDKRDFANFKLPQSFGDFVKWVEPQPVHTLNEHWKPISAFCGIEDGMKFDMVARLEEIDDWGPALVERTGIEAFVDNGWGGGFFRSDGDGVAHNHRSEQRLKEFYTPELMRIVERIYKKDFDRFGYTIGELI